MRRIDKCMNCGDERELVANSLCAKCYMRAVREGGKRNEPFSASPDRSQRRYIAERNKMLLNLTKIVKLVDETPCISPDDIQAIKTVIRPYLVERAESLAPVPEVNELTQDSELTAEVNESTSQAESTVDSEEKAELKVTHKRRAKYTVCGERVVPGMATHDWARVNCEKCRAEAPPIAKPLTQDSKLTTKADVTKVEDEKEEKPTPDAPKIVIKLTKAERNVVAVIYTGSMFDDSDMLRDNLGEHRGGMDDAAFDAWIEENYIDAAQVVGNSLVFDTAKPLWRVVAQDTVDNIWNKTKTDWCDPRELIGPYDDRRTEFHASALANSRWKCCENVVQKIMAAAGVRHGREQFGTDLAPTPEVNELTQDSELTAVGSTQVNESTSQAESTVDSEGQGKGGRQTTA